MRLYFHISVNESPLLHTNLFSVMQFYSARITFCSEDSKRDLEVKIITKGTVKGQFHIFQTFQYIYFII